MLQVFGDVLSQLEELIDYASLKRILTMPVVVPLFRITVLHPDETVNYEIPSIDIPLEGISYSEEYTNGSRRSITLLLINEEDDYNSEILKKGGKYTPSIKGLWLNSKFKFEVGVRVKSREIWFPKGIYIMGDVSLSERDAEHTVSILLKDKYSIFEGKLGTLHEAYEIEIGSDIELVLSGLLSSDTGDGYIIDYKKVIMDPSLRGMKTQSTIRVEAGGSIHEVIDALATQMSAEYYYNNVGNLCFYPTTDTCNDSDKPVIWVFQNGNQELYDIQMDYKNEDVVNVVKVVGDNISQGVKYAIAENNNPLSPICIQQIGRRKAEIIEDANIWSNDLAQDLANYNLRKNSFVGVDFSCNIAFNPLFIVNNICEVENDFLNFHREKLLITSISYESPSGQMTVKLCNTKELPQ